MRLKVTVSSPPKMEERIFSFIIRKSKVVTITQRLTTDKRLNLKLARDKRVHVQTMWSPSNCSVLKNRVQPDPQTLRSCDAVGFKPAASPAITIAHDRLPAM